jgi:cytochrome d ubiquinol oxidase subunit I
MFWVFRVMAGLGFFFIAFFAAAFWMASVRRFACDSAFCRTFLRAAVWVIPLPWIAIEFGWILAEVGRQPWAIEGVLPTFLAASSLTVAQLWTTIVGFTVIYGALAVIEVRLMLAAIRKGPDAPPAPTATPAAPNGYAPIPAE